LPRSAWLCFAIGIGVLCIATVYLQHEHSVSITAQQATAQALAAEMTGQIASRQARTFALRTPWECDARKPRPRQHRKRQRLTMSPAGRNTFATQLPNGAGSIALDTSTVPPMYAVTVSWSQPRGGLVSYTVRASAYSGQLTAQRAQKSDAIHAAN